MLTWYFIETLNCCRHNRRPWLQLCPKSHWKVSTKSGMGLDLPQQGHRWECEVVESCSRIMCWASKWKNLAMVQTYCTNIPTFHSKIDKFWFYGSKHSNIPLHILNYFKGFSTFAFLMKLWKSPRAKVLGPVLCRRSRTNTSHLDLQVGTLVTRESVSSIYSFTMSHSIWVAMKIHIPTPYSIERLSSWGGGSCWWSLFNALCMQMTVIVVVRETLSFYSVSSSWSIFNPSLLDWSSLILTRALVFSKTLMRPKKYPAYYSLHDLHPHSIQTKFTYISWERKRFLVFLL